MVRTHVPEPEYIDLGDEGLSEKERHDLLYDLMLTLLDKHRVLTRCALLEMMNQLIMQHGLRDAAKFVWGAGAQPPSLAARTRACAEAAILSGIGSV